MRELDKVIGYENIKKELYRIIDIIRNPEKYKELGVSVPKGILLDGEPGIGKTLMAKCFIKETGLKSFVIRKDMPDGEFVDHIRETFKRRLKKHRLLSFWMILISLQMKIFITAMQRSM